MPMRTSSNPALYTFDAAKRAEHGNICGVDEAGRGPLCGPVCVAAVILNPDDPIEGVNDSKKLSEKRREALFDEIIARALCYQIVFISPQEIDERNILWATMDGMEQAVAGLAVTPDYVLVDGNRCPPNLAQPAEAVVKGDANSASIAAASILAKVSRDRYMLELDKQYPQYQLAKHKGYPTKLHYELIEQYGIQDYIRQGYLLLNHNYRTRMGELDLILYKADTIVFAEVKTRTSAQRAAPAEAVDYYKQQRLIAAAGQYLQQSPYADANIRFDVVEVLPAGSGWQVHCIRDAFASE